MMVFLKLLYNFYIESYFKCLVVSYLKESLVRAGRHAFKFFSVHLDIQMVGFLNVESGCLIEPGIPKQISQL